MNPGLWLCLFLLLLLLLYQWRQQKMLAVRRHIAAKKRMKGVRRIMPDMIAQYIDKECLIYTMNAQLSGTIRSVEDGWLSVENSESKLEMVNLDYVTRIREYPLTKKGRKRSIVVD